MYRTNNSFKIGIEKNIINSTHINLARKFNPILRPNSLRPNVRFFSNFPETRQINQTKNQQNSTIFEEGLKKNKKDKKYDWDWAMLIGMLFLGTSLTVASAEEEEKEKDPNTNLPIVKATLTKAPQVPPPIDRDYPVHLIADIDVQIYDAELDTGVKYEYWSFNGSVPGPFIRARVGDVMEVRITNCDASGMLHNMDFHSVSGPGGGAQLTTVDYLETKNATFKLLHPGLFIYHCAVDPVGAHIGNGMYGLMLVEPEGGLPKVDHEFFVVQSEFYVLENNDREASCEMDLDRGLNEDPTHVVFNGRVRALVDNPLKVKTGDKVRIFFGNAGPNLVSSFHIIGTIFSKVYREGDLVSPPARSLQTTLVPAGGATVIECEPPVPGTFTLVDHSIWRTEKGAVGFLDVEGPPRPDIYHSIYEPRNCPDCKHHK